MMTGPLPSRRRNRSASDRAPALPFWAWATVASFSAALLTAAVPTTVAVYEVGLPIALAISTVQSGSLVIAVIRPRLGAALQLASVIALVLVTRGTADAPWPLPVTGLISLGALILLLGIRERWTVSVTTWWLSILVLVGLVAISPERYADTDQWGTNLTIYSSYTVTVLAAAIALGQRRRIRDDLATARRDVELEQAQRLYVEERARIARELHDVVAHSMSLVHMQALSAPFRLTDSPRAATDEEFDQIARSARSALNEMRQLLGALRASDDSTDLLPQPQLSDVPELAAATSRAGTVIEVHIDERASLVSPIVQLTIYRIVQEALSNVVRHAPAAHTRVTVSASPATLEITVRNTAPPDRDRGDGVSSPDRGGQGLRGMRERVNLLGGRPTTGPTADGGFAVEVLIPQSSPRSEEIE